MPSGLAELLVVLTSVLRLTCANGQGATNDVTDQRFLPPLTNVQQVLDLGAYQAREKSRPVRLRGTVVSHTPRAGYVFLHDQTACILVMVSNAPPGLGVAKLVLTCNNK